MRDYAGQPISFARPKQLHRLNPKGFGDSADDDNGGVEKLVQMSDLAWTILRPADFMQNLETVHAEAIRFRNEIAVPAGRGRSAFIDVADIGAVAARIIGEPSHGGQSNTLTGPVALSFVEIARALTAVLGRTITYRSPNGRSVAACRRLVRPTHPPSRRTVLVVSKHSLLLVITYPKALVDRLSTAVGRRPGAPGPRLDVPAADPRS